MPRAPLIIAPEAISDGLARIGGQHAHHLLNVLRLGKGDDVRISNGADAIYQTRISHAGRAEIEADILDQEALPAEPTPAIELIQVLPKPALLDRVVGPSTALGVSAIRCVAGDHTPIGSGTEKWESRLDRWALTARTAAEQSERARTPIITFSYALGECLDVHPTDVRILADETRAGQETVGMGELLQAAGTAQGIQLLIGPEAGLSEEEREAAIQAGATPVSLGPNILRLELATLVALSVTMHELGRLR